MDMSIATLRDRLEASQIGLYFAALTVGAGIGALMPGTSAWEAAITPALALMLFVTFLQVPLAELGRAFQQTRFLAVLLAANFVVVPAIVAILLPLAPDDAMVRLGVLLVLLTPCIDYVVTFAHLGRADARILLAATPLLLIAQMLVLPLQLRLFLGADAARLVEPGPFLHAFVWLIAVPLAMAAVVQLWTRRSKRAERAAAASGTMPVPATALVLLIVAAAVTPQLGQAIGPALGVLPIYLAFAAIAPLLGWGAARLARLDPPAGRTVAFSAATRNSLVVLPLALAVPGAVPLLPAIIVMQTMIELLAELVYIRAIPMLGRSR